MARPPEGPPVRDGNVSGARNLGWVLPLPPPIYTGAPGERPGPEGTPGEGHHIGWGRSRALPYLRR
jgi:hypothetical protein